MATTGRLPSDPLAGDNGVIAFAHRGGGGRWPENTMLAFQNAVDMGMDALEIDVHMTADGELVVIHDERVERVADGQGYVRDFTLAALKKLDAGYRWTPDRGWTFPYRGQGLTIPTLREVFATFPDTWINVDVKHHEPQVVDKFVALVEEYDLAFNLMVGSFDENTVTRFRRLLPRVKTAASPAEVKRLFVLTWLFLPHMYWGDATSLQVSESHNYVPLITSRLVKAAHHHTIAVHVWTVDEEDDMRRLIGKGVDGIMTDYPDRLLRLLGRL